MAANNHIGSLSKQYNPITLIPPSPLTDGIKVILLFIPCPILSLPEITKQKSASVIKNLILTEIFG